MNDQYIIINIKSNGKVQAETFNMEGMDCVDEINKLMQALAQLETETKKPEYFKQSVKTIEKVAIKK